MNINLIKESLGIEGDISLSNLYEYVYKKRNEQHPDKFTSEELKKQAEEKFKKYNEWFDYLDNLIEAERLKESAGALVVSDKNFETIHYVQKNLMLEKEINSLKTLLSATESMLSMSKEDLKRISSVEIDKKTAELQKMYTPQKTSVGVVFILAFLGSILIKIESIAIVLKKYFPFSEEVSKVIIFTILVISLLIFLKKLYDEKSIEKTGSSGISVANFTEK